MCPHDKKFCPTELPISNRMNGIFLLVRWAAAARPIGPPPIIATGRFSFFITVFLDTAMDDGF